MPVTVKMIRENIEKTLNKQKELLLEHAEVLSGSVAPKHSLSMDYIKGETKQLAQARRQLEIIHSMLEDLSYDNKTVKPIEE